MFRQHSSPLNQYPQCLLINLLSEKMYFLFISARLLLFVIWWLPNSQAIPPSHANVYETMYIRISASSIWNHPKMWYLPGIAHKACRVTAVNPVQLSVLIFPQSIVFHLITSVKFFLLRAVRTMELLESIRITTLTSCLF